MQRWTTPVRLAAATTFVVAASAAITPAVAQATGPTTGVTVFLQGPNNAALHRLAEAHGLTYAQRMHALRQLLPTTDEHAKAVEALQAAGLTVTDQSAWSISATAPSTTVARAFGAHAVAHAHATPAEKAAAVGPYPTIPASLQGIATAAYPTTGGPAFAHHADVTCNGCLTGDDFRNAYAAPQTLPDSGLNSKATLTIATIQLAGWNPGDLTNWAFTPGNVVGPDFNAAEDLTMVPVDQAAVPPPSSNDTGDEEVDLDQQALLGTDPYAHQRPYFAPNTGAGEADAYAQVVDDVLQDGNAYQGGDSHIVAVSTSWGSCEADNPLGYIKVLEPILTSLVAAGVTIFSASGDQGIYDNCSASTTGVDFPSASPEVVAVGGTSLAPVGTSKPNNGSNWTEVAWGCISADDCINGNGGSGGGISTVFAKPAYQGKITNAPFAAANARLVPDISADADPATGYRIYTTDPSETHNSSAYLQIGGTSLAAPESAALFTNALAAHGATSGIGDIHQGLYNAYAAKTGAFRDITSGTNGVTGDAGTDPSVSAGPGYDTVTGLGSPLWSAVAPFLFAAEPPLPPKATATLSLPHPTSATLSRQLTAAWTSVVSSTGIALQGAAVTITRAGQTQPVYSNATAPPTGSYTFTGVAGATYLLTVVAQDIDSNKSKSASDETLVPFDDNTFKYSGQWHRTASPNAYAGSAEFTDRRHSFATATAKGSTYGLLVQTGPSFGKLRISWNGFVLRTVSLYSATPGSRLIPFFDSSKRQSRTFTFTVLGTSQSPSFGGTVGLDGLAVSY